MIQVPLNFSRFLTPFLVVLLMIVSFALGALWQKVNYLEKNGVGVKALGAETANTNQVKGPADPLVSVKASSLNIPPVTDKDHIQGSRDARLTWIEYSDLECPFCKQIHPSLVKILDDYGGRIKWVYRHFPLDPLHPKARQEAIAAECAAALGGSSTFWSYIEGIFEITPSNNGLDPLQLPKIAVKVGVNKSEFEKCLSGGKYADVVNADYEGGVRAGVNGTPGNFLLDDKGNAWVISGAVPYSTMKQIIETALKN